MDGLLLTHLAPWLNKELKNSRLGKDIVLVDDYLYFPVYTASQSSLTSIVEKKCLLFSLKTNKAEIVLLEKDFLPLKEEKNHPFSISLRKLIANSDVIIESIEAHPFERILYLHLKKFNTKNNYLNKRDEHFEKNPSFSYFHLVFEMMGRQTNLLLLDENQKIIDAYHFIEEKSSKSRLILPNIFYTLPNLGEKIKWFSLDEEVLKNTLKTFFTETVSFSEKDLQKSLCQKFLGISPLIIKYIGKTAPKNFDSFIKIFYEIKAQFQKLSSHFYIESNKDGSLFCSLFPLSTPNNNLNKNNLIPHNLPILEAIRFCHHFNNEKKDHSKKIQHFLNFINKNLEAITKKEKIYLAEVASSSNFSLDKLKGELLLCYLNEIDKSSTILHLKNPYLPELNEVIEIKINPALSISDNSALYFKKAKKDESKYNLTKQFIQDLSAEKMYFEAFKKRLSEKNICSTEEIISFDEEFLFFSEKRKKRKKYAIFKDKKIIIPQINIPYTPLKFKNTNYKKPSLLPKTKTATSNTTYRKIFSSSNLTILVGKNNLQNDELARQSHHAKDLWFHINGRQGPHVILKAGSLTNGIFDIDEKSIEEAASLAAWFAQSEDEKKMFMQEYNLVPQNDTISIKFAVDCVRADKIKKSKHDPQGVVHFIESPTLIYVSLTPAYKLIKNSLI